MLIFIILVGRRFFRSLQFTAINTVAYAEVDPPLDEPRPTLVSVNQQLAVSAGVAVGRSRWKPPGAAPCHRTDRRRVRAGLPRGRVHFGGVGVFLLQMPDDAARDFGTPAVEISSRKGAASAAAKARHRRYPGRAGSALG